jgi:NhaP-type Na+/H+ or K+/H+ antiporter
MTYTIRDLWNDILNIDLIIVGQVILGVVVILIIGWWLEKLGKDNPITSTLWFLAPFVIFFLGIWIYSQFTN